MPSTFSRRRVVHYRPHGKGVGFDCHRQELDAYEEHRTPERHPTLKGWTRDKAHPDHPEPRVTTHLSRVTCRRCWISIRFMARVRLDEIPEIPPRERSADD